LNENNEKHFITHFKPNIGKALTFYQLMITDTNRKLSYI